MDIKGNKYDFYTTNELKAAGWLKKQLEIQANGLNGNLDKVWPDVRDSAWIGGKREGWERVPYWLDGFIPLAYLLEDEDMIARAKKYVDAIISFQREDGWICPCGDSERTDYDTWAVLLITKVLCLYADCSGDERILDVVRKCLKQFGTHISGYTLRNWGAARWFEGLIAIAWVYERTGEEWLITLAKKLRIQGFDWRKIFDLNLLEDSKTGNEYISHIVNIAMMLKSEALWSKFDDIDAEEFANSAMEYLDKFHGMAMGHIIGDENLSVNSPIQGSELCGVVEFMYSYEQLFAVSGNVKWLDRLEELAFNSLPASISPDMWTHQYDQMVNQVASYPMSKQPFRNNNNEAHLFGLEPNFGCCTANFGQGFPKLALTAFMKAENTIVSCVLTPSVLETEIYDIPVKCELITEYPFRNTLKYCVTVEQPIEFTLSVRIPSFAKNAVIDGKTVNCGEFADIKRIWQGRTEIDVKLDFETEIVQRPENMVCLRRGPLFYSIPVKERWERVEYTANGVERKFPYCDYYIYPESKWNYALISDKFEVTENDFKTPFNPETPPISIKAEVVEIDWGFSCGHCDRKPKSLIPQSENKEIEFIPYGCTNLRITEMPFIQK